MSSQPQRVTSGQTHKQMHISKFSFLNWIHKIIPYMNIKHTYTNTNFWSIDSCQKRHNGVGGRLVLVKRAHGGGGKEVDPCQKSTWGWGWKNEVDPCQKSTWGVETGWSLSKRAHGGVGGRNDHWVRKVAATNPSRAVSGFAFYLNELNEFYTPVFGELQCFKSAQPV